MSSSSERRILIALDAYSATEPGLATLVSIARRLNASLTGLYIEDRQLMSVAELPFSTEINYLSAEERELEPAELMRLNKIASTRARRLLEKLSTQDKLSWTFSEESGELAICALSHQGCDIFFPGRIRPYRKLQQPSPHPHQQLALIYHCEVEFERMLEVVRLLSVNGMVTDVTIVSETPLPPEIAGKLPVQGIRLHFQLVHSTHPQQLQYLKLPGSSLVLMSKSALSGLTERQLAELPEQLCYPLMLVD
ncbi:MAG: hypothetical protein EP324_00040 [Gammaproteobacteria bacterium]|nr:MAG: hypothetical protein EP324_00040 [Gammaproteobacteria bacterium]